jgi:uncharacterized protein HemX
MTVRIATTGLLAALGLLIGLGVGYLLWGRRAADLAERLRQQRSEYEYRLSEQERRARAAEDRARHEAEARTVLENELHKVRPLK